MRLVDADQAAIYLNQVACEQIQRMPTLSKSCCECKSFSPETQKCKNQRGLPHPHAHSFCHLWKKRGNP